MKLATTACLVTVTVLPFAIANADRGGERGPGRKPPAAAFAACASAKQGDACTVAFGDHSASGTCEAAPDTTALACRPNHPPGPPGPPPQAIEACRSAQEGAACSVKHGERTLSGTCAKGPGGALACRPEGGPPPR